MKSISQTILYALMIMVFIQEAVNAQTNIQKFQIGIQAGAFIYEGDLTPSPVGSYRTLRPAFSLFASKLMSSSLAVRGNLAFGMLRGNDAAYSNPEYRQHRNFSFRTPIVELSAIAEWNPFSRNYASKGFVPYLFAGGGISLLKISRDYSGFDAGYFGENSELPNSIAADAAHSTPRVLLVLPIGVGARYYLSDRIGLTAETSYRIMSNDYLDGFSLAANPAKGDHYHSHTVGMVYRIGKKNLLDCPVVKY